MTFYRLQKRYGDTIKLPHTNVLVISIKTKKNKNTKPIEISNHLISIGGFESRLPVTHAPWSAVRKPPRPKSKGSFKE